MVIIMFYYFKLLLAWIKNLIKVHPVRLNLFFIFIFLAAFLQEVGPCGWTDWAVWASIRGLGTFPASYGVREGSDLGLIPDIELNVKSRL